MIRLNKRQDEILSLLESGGLSVSEIREKLSATLGEVSKITVNRDLEKLIGLNYAARTGRARAARYFLSPHFNLVRPVKIEEYFKVEPDKRDAKERFDFSVFAILKNIFTSEEGKRLNELNEEYRKNLKKLSPALRKKEFERLVIELSWKSSLIEGNTYTLLETESLIKEKKEPKGHKKEEAIMILNHKKTLDYIRKNQNKFKTVSVSKIEDIHYLLTKGLGISRSIRKSAVGITGTKYKPLDNQFKIREALEKTCRLINKEKDFFAKALLVSVMIAYIQPFEDGNKRTSRLTANAVLMAHGSCPLSYRSVDETEYKKAVILFYEQNNISYFKKLFIEQFEFAVKNYFT
ncbi:MAG: Fic family protein [bacterium]|nr:Fic family protein [bacterium]